MDQMTNYKFFLLFCTLLSIASSLLIIARALTALAEAFVGHSIWGN